VRDAAEIFVKGNSPADIVVQMVDFLVSIREPRTPDAGIEEGHKSALHCRLGNFSFRTGRSLHCDPHNGHILQDEEAMRPWTREYRPGREPNA